MGFESVQGNHPVNASLPMRVCPMAPQSSVDRCDGIGWRLTVGSCVSITQWAACRHQLTQATQVRSKEKKTKDYTFLRQTNEKPSIIPGCPVLM